MPGYQYGKTTQQAAPKPDPRPVPAKPITLPVWEEPPAAAVDRKSNRDKIVAALKKSPGKWARVQDGMKYSPTPAWKKSGCEAVARKDESTGLYTVWARWPEGGQ